jgi:transcriptional regulator with GAF, ATPase, and Fis domain
MPQSFEQIRRQRALVLGLTIALVAGLCVMLVLTLSPNERPPLPFEQWRPAVFGLCGIAALFAAFAFVQHRRLTAQESRLRDLAVRDAAVQARFSELSFLFDASTQALLQLDTQAILDLAAQRLLPCLDAHHSSIMMFNEASGLLEVRASSGIDAERVAKATMRPGEGVAGLAFSGGEVLNLTAASMKQRFPDQPDYGRQIAAGLCVPMRHKGTPMGVVSVSRTSGEPFSELHARTLAAFAEHCAAAVTTTTLQSDLLGNLRKAG